MNYQEISKEELIKELQGLQQENNALKAACEKCINEKKQVEHELFKINEKSRFKTEIVANMSHEIRTPLNGIWGLSEVLLIEELLTHDRKEIIKNINQSSIKLKNIIEEFFEVLFIDGGRKAIFSDTNILKISEDIYSSIKPNVEAKGIKLTFNNILPLKELIIKTDEFLIGTILAKLIQNALFFTKEGSIEIGCGLNMVSDPVEIEFYVKDTGMGIPQEKILEIFEPYKMLYACDPVRSEATGLELFIAKTYVELLGGNMRVESIAGKGSTFYFSIPDNRNHEPYLN